jgi:PhoH-like ATPase
MRRLHGSARWTHQVADHHPDRSDKSEKKEVPHPTVEALLQSRTLEIAPINYLRGRSIHDTAIIVDDGQNLTLEDMKLVLTRAGEGSRVILTGDPDQIDRKEINSLSNGLVQVVERFKGQPCFAHLTMHEVMRSRVAEMAARLL